MRASVRNYDVDMPANTIRAWVIGLLLTTVGSGVNMLFSLRYPTVSVTTYVIQLIAYPIGLGWDLIFPDHQFNVFGLKFNFKPGPFNFKEHVVIVVMSNVSTRSPRTALPSNSEIKLTISYYRRHMAAVLFIVPMLSWPSRSSTASTSVGVGSSCSASPRSARATVLPAWAGDSSSGPPP